MFTDAAIIYLAASAHHRVRADPFELVFQQPRPAMVALQQDSLPVNPREKAALDGQAFGTLGDDGGGVHQRPIALTRYVVRVAAMPTCRQSGTQRDQVAAGEGHRARRGVRDSQKCRRRVSEHEIHQRDVSDRLLLRPHHRK